MAKKTKKKSKRVKKAAKRAPAKKKKAQKSKTKTKPKKKAVKKAPVRKTAKKAAPAKKKTAKKAPAKKKKQTVGEGDYQASRTFLKDQAGFVKKNKGKIADMGKAAETALDGPEGDSLRAAEAEAAARSRDTF